MNISQEAFGEKIGASQSAVQKWETGKARPNSRFLVEISSKFKQFNRMWVLSGEGDPYDVADLQDRVHVKDDIKVDMHRASDPDGLWGKTKQHKVEGKDFTVTTFGPKEQNKADSFINAIAGLKDIFEKGNDTLKTAIMANIDAFRMSSMLVDQVDYIVQRLDKIEKMIQAVLDQHKPPAGEERRKAFIDMKRALNE